MSFVIRHTPEFDRRYGDLTPAVQRKAERRERIFRENPFSPLLDTEKLAPKEKEYWSFRIDHVYRIIFRFDTDGSIILITCGHHKWIYRYLLNH